MKVVGIERISFTGKDGALVTFDRVSLLSDIPSTHGVGKSAEVVRCSPDKTAGVAVGDDVEISYNKYGKVRYFDIVGK